MVNSFIFSGYNDYVMKNELEEIKVEKVTLGIAKELIEAAVVESNNIGVQMVITVVDEGGNLVATHRMDDAWLASIEISQNKAWTSVALKMPTESLAVATSPGNSLYGLNTTNSGKIVVFGGGIPLVSGGNVIGAVGVSGSSVDVDIQVAKVAFEKFNKMLEEK